MGTHALIRHTFYQKVTTSPLVFYAQGAYGWKAKITTLAEELGRMCDEQKSDVMFENLKSMNCRHSYIESYFSLSAIFRNIISPS